MAEKTKICCFDVDKNSVKYLKEEHEVFEGTLGKKINMPSKRSCSEHVLPNYHFPKGMHEYDVFIFDMGNSETIDFFRGDYISVHNETTEEKFIICERSVTTFNPIPIGAFAFNRLISEKKDKKPIYIVFQKDYIQRQYKWCNQNDYHLCTEEFYNYEFVRVPEIENRYGKQVVLTDRRVSELLFKNRLDDVEYFCVYDCIGRKGFVPLLLNKNGECVSYVQISDNAIVFMLPQMKDKAAFLKHLFENLLYENFSEYFPAVEEKRWIHKKEYLLPNEERMRKELEQAKKEYEAKKAEIEARMVENREQYEFLHTMITGTGDELVKAVIQYLEWLGFEDVVNADEDEGREYNEEDIRITIPDGLFILEVKGIHHNSTDDECARVGKYKLRWMEELKTTNVKALYVVNHQRNVEPIKRDNPPFTDVQKSDARSGYRGMVTTWQLYNLYYDIERGVISKADVREALMQYGLVEFAPKGAVKLGLPYRYCRNNVICVELNGQTVTKGEEMYAYDGQHWHKAEVLSIEIDNQRVESVDNGHVGFGLSEELPEKVEVYVKHKEE